MVIHDPLQTVYDRLESMSVRVVIFPLPPSPVDGLYYFTDSFASKTFDANFERPDELHIISIRSTELGPAILGQMKLKHLINYSNGASSNLVLRHAAVCATASSYDCSINGKNYAADTVIDRLVWVHRSCHPGSHFSIPQAPFLTAYLQFHTSPNVSDDREESITYSTPWDAEKLFSEVDFNRNKAIDDFVSRCYIPNDISVYKTLSGIGMWAQSYLKHMRLNQFRKDKNGFYRSESEEVSRCIESGPQAQGIERTICGEGDGTVFRRSPVPLLQAE